jgi:hypothetical protein
MAERAATVLGRRPRWLGTVAREAHTAYRFRPADAPRALAATVDRSLADLDARGRLGRPPRSVPGAVFSPEMGRTRWPVPEAATTTDLAALLDLHPGYRYRWLARQAAPPRLIESPKALLKETQRRILHGILDAIPPHEAAQGFRRGHSAVTHARRHTGRDVVVRFDLEDFFASVTAGRVYGIFRAAGYRSRSRRP